MNKVTATYLMLPLAVLLAVAAGCGEATVETPHPGYLGEGLLDAAKEGDAGTAGSLIERGSDVNAQNARGYTPLYLAAE